MELRKYRWSRAYESAEEELVQFLAAKNIEAKRWISESGTVFAPHVHEHDKRLWCAEGSITFKVDGKNISLQPGDALDLPAYTVHEAIAGFMGCACYESPKDNPVIPAS
ncbi:MAG: Cupin domain protein [Candidatus Saccharibacteria bacterium]|nr:Cupin domain protein [Candidatus Saccharibacteria bacterium]